jgi:hypothetical protein
MVKVETFMLSSLAKRGGGRGSTRTLSTIDFLPLR